LALSPLVYPAILRHTGATRSTPDPVKNTSATALNKTTPFVPTLLGIIALIGLALTVVAMAWPTDPIGVDRHVR